MEFPHAAARPDSGSFHRPRSSTACAPGAIQPDEKGDKKGKGPGDPNSEVCGASTVHSFSLPRNYDDLGDGTFTYSFDYLPAEAGKPTVVYIPGGPGQAAIGGLEKWKERVPAGYGLILTDPRGVACNYFGTEGLKTSFYQSEFVARDVLSAAKEMQLQDYVIYGISYGTLVATMAGSIAETEAGWLKPKAIVMEGVVGRAFEDAEEADEMYSALWTRHLSALNAEVGTTKASQYMSGQMPMDYSEMDWLRVIRMSMMYGSIIDKTGVKTNVTYKLMKSAVSDSAEDQAFAKDVFDKLSGPVIDDVPGVDRFYSYIACSEVFPDLRSPQFSNGVMTRTGANLCTANDIQSPAPRFKASSWPITAPIYYFQGVDDPATPASIAVSNNYAVQTGSLDRMFALVGDGGHNPLGINLVDCKDKLWDAMTHAGDFQGALETCAWTKQATIWLSDATETHVLGLAPGTTPTDTPIPPVASSLRLTSFLGR